MSETNSLLNIPLVSRVRRNHALEHATMNVLGENYGKLRLVARSAPSGFYIYGDVPTEGVIAAVQEGLQRLRAGRWQMAIHPTCGTNLAVSGVLAGIGAFLALGGLSRNRSKGFLHNLTLLPAACAAAMIGILIAQPLGPLFQAHVTTQADVGDLSVIDVTQERRAGVLVHHVHTGG